MNGREVICSAPALTPRWVLAPVARPLYVAFSSLQKGWLLCFFCQRSQAPTCNIFANTWPEITEEFALCPSLDGCARRSSFCRLTQSPCRTLIPSWLDAATLPSGTEQKQPRGPWL